jgi:hypothetical protein
MFKWAFGKHNDRTLKSYARANLLVMLSAFILVGALVAWVLAMPEFFASLVPQA